MAKRKRQAKSVVSQKLRKHPVVKQPNRLKRAEKPDLHLRNYLLENDLELGC